MGEIDPPAWWAHPRSRGENLAGAGGVIAVWGSSPLTRGKRTYRVFSYSTLGLIPAHAGKTSAPASWCGRTWAHPRSRGENRRPGAQPGTGGGSSPLTRGKRHVEIDAHAQVGLIPAHAGKTCEPQAHQTRPPAHPRSRGENPGGVPVYKTCEGSSPLTRGKHFLTCAFTAQIGQILESLELCASSESYSSPDAYATDAP